MKMPKPMPIEDIVLYIDNDQQLLNRVLELVDKAIIPSTLRKFVESSDVQGILRSRGQVVVANCLVDAIWDLQQESPVVQAESWKWAFDHYKTKISEGVLTR